MRNLIALRNVGALSPVRRRMETPTASPTKEGRESKESLDHVVNMVEEELQCSLETHDTLQEELQRFATRWKEVSEVDRAHNRF